jgi:hypothetical protein
MSSFNFAKADVDWEMGRRLIQVVTALETQTILCLAHSNCVLPPRCGGSAPAGENED